MHTLSLLYQLTTELATADESSDSSSSSSSDSEEDARNEALGLGGAKLKAVLSEINKTSQLGVSPSSIAVKGGEVLAILHDRTQNMSGDPAAKELYGVLIEAAGKPYVDMLQAWIRTGKLVDPYEEMCIKESKFIDRGTLEMDYTDEYWERRYTVSICRLISMSALTNVWPSYETERPLEALPNGTRLAYRLHEPLAADCREVHACHQPWRGGSTKFYWLANTSTLYGSVA